MTDITLGPVWLVAAKPGETKPPALAADEAKKRGYYLHYGDTAPQEPTVDGLPVVWVQGVPQDLIPVVPQIPAFNLAHRKVAIPDNQVGVQYYLNGKAVDPGIHTVPGEGFTHFRVSAEPKAGYITTGKYEWIRAIASVQGRELWVSEKPSLRPAGQELNPPVEGSTGTDSKGFGAGAKRAGVQMNNGFGGYGTATFYQLGAGWTKAGNETEWKHASWIVSDHGTLVEQHPSAITLLYPFTRNLTIEFDLVPAPENLRKNVLFWIGHLDSRKMYMADIGMYLVSLSGKDGTKETREVPFKDRAGTWKLEFVNDIYTITAPNGWSATQDFSHVDGELSQGLIGMRLDTKNECAGLRIYKRRDEGVNNAQ